MLPYIICVFISFKERAEVRGRVVRHLWLEYQLIFSIFLHPQKYKKSKYPHLISEILNSHLSPCELHSV